jgi:azurin
MNARETDYVPADQKAHVIASTKLAGPGETVDVTFKVPAKAGTYSYMCTFPGHYTAGMKGQLVVQ